MTMFDFGSGPVPAHRHRNPDGTEGGWVADTAIVEPTCFVGSDVKVSGNAMISGNAKVFGIADIKGEVGIFGEVEITTGIYQGNEWLQEVPT